MAPKGKSHSRRPVSKRAPSWCRYSPEEAEAFVIQLAKEGYPPSQIGILLRDQYGIPLIKYLTGKSITEIMESAGVSLELPEDLQNLLQKATRLQRHMTSKVRRLANYYRDRSVLPKDWKYTS